MAKLDIYNEKLTPSAKEALSETINELQEMLIEKANSIAQKGSAEKEISLRDILEAKESLFKVKIEKGKADFIKKRLITLISLTGVLYSIIGIFVYIYQTQNLSIQKDIGLIIAFTGIVTAFVGFAYSQLVRSRVEEKQNASDSDFRNSVDDFEVIRRWQIIEKMGSALMRQNGYSDNESKSINDILKFLAVELKSDQLYKEMRELLSVRNKILHEGYDLSKQEKQIYVNNANKIIEQLDSLEK